MGEAQGTIAEVRRLVGRDSMMAACLIASLPIAIPRAFGVLVGHLPSAILSLPAFVSRSPPDNSCMYPSWISRSLCSAGIVRCVKPLAQSRNETNSSWVNGADKSGFIFQICASGAAVQASHPATIKLSHYRAFRLDVRPARMWQRGCFPTKTLVPTFHKA
jgi:hypothetical protein